MTPVFRFLWLAVFSLAFAAPAMASIVVPSPDDADATPLPQRARFLEGEGRYQQRFGRSEFREAGPSFEIQQLVFRADRPQAPFTVSADVKVRLAVLPRWRRHLSPRFARNLVRRPRTVFEGTVTWDFDGNDEITRSGDLVLTLDTPYQYRPRLGDLVLDIQVSNGTGPVVWVRGTDASRQIDSLYAAGSDARVATDTLRSAGVTTRFVGQSASSAPARLVADLGIDEGPASSEPIPLGSVGGRVVFLADTPATGREFWAVSRAGGAPELLGEVLPGTEGVRTFVPFAEGAERVFALATMLRSGRREPKFLWSSDGTVAGTRSHRLDLDVLPPLMGLEDSVLLLVREGDPTQFRTVSLYRSDGTREGTRSVATLAGIDTGAGTLTQTAQLGNAHFIRTRRGSSPPLWRTDGTASGTIPIDPEGLRSARDLVAAGGVLFLLNGNSNATLWRSDGTEAGTAEPWPAFRFGPTARLAATETHALVLDGSTLWILDPVEPPEPVQIPSPFGLRFIGGSGSRVFLSANREVVELNLDTRAFQLVFSEPGSYAEPTDGGGTFFAASGGDIWVASAPGEAGQRLPLEFVRADPLNLGGEVWFGADDGERGSELWASDGTEAGTRLVANLSPDRSEGRVVGIAATESALLAALNGSASRGVYALGQGLPPQQLAVGGTFVLDRGESVSLAAIGERFYFSTSYGPRPFSSTAPEDIWTSDGTLAGTIALSDDGRSKGTRFAPYLDGAIFNFTRESPFRTGVQFRDAAGELTGFQSAAVESPLVAVGTIVFSRAVTFLARTTARRRTLVADPNATNVDWITSDGSGVYFAGDESGFGRELRRVGIGFTNRRVIDVNPGPEDSDPAHLMVLGNRVYFSADGGGGAGAELWSSDGTEANTRLVADLLAGSAGAYPENLAPLGTQRFFFSAYTFETGREPWTSDGTLEGTRPLGDLDPGPVASNPGAPFEIPGGHVFPACTTSEGCELWETDGSPEGTRRLADIAPGAVSSNPSGFKSTDTHLYFIADDGLSGREVWSIPFGTCGDGVHNPFETCDDGNLVAGDGCDALCELEPVEPCDPRPRRGWRHRWRHGGSDLPPCAERPSCGRGYAQALWLPLLLLGNRRLRRAARGGRG